MMSPAGGRLGRIAGRVFKLLVNHVDHHELGYAFAAETGFLISREPDTVRAPDAAFVGHEKMSQLEDDSGFLPFAPDLAIEVVSPHDSFVEVENKALAWLEAGTELVLIVEPESANVHSYRSRSRISVLKSDEILDASDVVDGWSVRISDLFN